MKFFQKGYTAAELLYLVVLGLGILAVGGWVWNIVKIISTDFSNITGMLIARVIGVFLAPLGAVLGFF